MTNTYDLASLYQSIQEQKDLKALSFFMTHYTPQIFDYQKILVFKQHNRRIDVLSVSDVVELDRNSPFGINVRKCFQLLTKKYKGKSKSIVKFDAQTEKGLQDYWPKVFNSQALLVQFRDDRGVVIGGFMMIYNQPSQDKDELAQEDSQSQDQHNQTMLEVSKAYEFAFQKHFVKYEQGVYWYRRLLAKTPLWWGVTVAIIVLMFAPVRQSVVAPAEIVAKDSRVITAPFDGVVSHVLVQPYQHVGKGVALFKMDTQDIDNEQLKATKALETAKQKFYRSINAGFKDIKNRADIKILKSEMQEKKVSIDYTNHLLEESDVRAPQNGVAIIDNPHQWEGKPVRTGEKVLEVANEKQVEVKVWMPVSDSIKLKKGNEVKLFLTNQPLSSIEGKIKYVATNAELMDNNVLAYPIVATIKADDHVLPKIGSQGNARVYGQRTTLFVYLFRKPLTSARQFIGW